MSNKHPPFDLAKALAGEPCVLRDGSKYYVMYDASEWLFHQYCLIGHPDGDGRMFTHDKDGVYFNKDRESDIIGMWVEPHELDGMPKDHPIWVFHSVDSDWIMWHFHGLDVVRDVVVYNSGRTSATSYGTNAFELYKLPTAEELIGTSWEGSKFVRSDENV